MEQYRDSEYHIPARETSAPGDEFNDTYVGREEYENRSEDPPPRRAKRRKLLLLQIAAAVSVTVAIHAAFGQDPLGSDFLGSQGSAAPSSPAAYDDAFPVLPNPDPDFAGNAAWSGLGSEEYVIVDSQFLHAGTFYTDVSLQGENAVTPANLPGAAYDRASNTLTLDNYHGGFVDVNLMGNGFKIRLIGENTLDSIRIWGAMYGGSVTFTGSGSITLNESGAAGNGVGLYLECEDSMSCVMIDREATVEVFGDCAVIIHRTMLEKAIYCLRPVQMTGGTYGTGEFVEYNVTVTDEDGNVVLDENGDPVTAVKTVKDISADLGLTLYDCSVVGSDGRPAKHVLFAPGE